MNCTKCGDEAFACFCGFQEVNKDNYHRALKECKDLKCYCTVHFPGSQTSLKPTYVFSKAIELPEEFAQGIESDLNKAIEMLPDYLEKKYQEITKHRNYVHPFEFLIGWCIGTCESSYFQAYQYVFKKIPSEEQITEIRKIISRRRIQIEQAIFAFLKENDEKIK